MNNGMIGMHGAGMDLDERGGLPSASGAVRYMHCPLSHRLEATVPKTESVNPLATEGSIIHEALEREDCSELTLDQNEIAAKLSETEKILYDQWRLDFPINDKGSVIREERFWIFDSDVRTGSAKPDVVYIIGTHALCIDMKTGHKQVEDASKNLQGRLQALAIWQNFPEVVHVRSAFAQFRLTRFFTYCDYTKQDLEYALKEWDFAVWRAARPDAQAIPGDHCLYCRAKPICRAAAAYSMLPAVTVPMMLKTDKVAISNAVGTLAHSDLVSLHERGPIIKNVLEAVSARLKSLSVEELKALGLELKAGSKYTTKVEVNPLFQLLWDFGLWNHVADETERLEVATREFSSVTTVLTGKLAELAIPHMTQRNWFKTKKAAEEHLKDLLAQVSTQETKEPTLRRIKSE